MKCFLLEIAAALSLFLAMPSPVASAADVIMVKECGVSAAGNSQQAVTDAQKKAVARILSKMIAVNESPGSVYQKISQQYQCFAGKPEVTARQLNGAGLELYCKVPVKATAMHDMVRSEIQQLQQKHGDAVTGFLLRVTGIPEAEIARKQAKNIMETTFQNMGFQTSDALDEMTDAIAKYDGKSYEEYQSGISQQVRQDYPEIINTVVGQIEIHDIASDEAGTTVSGDIQLTVFDMLDTQHTKPFTFFRESYAMRGKDRQQAIELFIYKAAMNASRNLEDQTLLYWQHH